MRMGRALVALAAALLSACAPLRHAVPPGPAPGGRDALLDGARNKPVTGPRPLTCISHPTIDVWEQRIGTRGKLGAWTRESLSRGEAYLPRLRSILEDTGVPPTLALLPAIESGFRPRVRGSKGDVGLWQLRGPTARRFGLVVNGRHDDRLQPDRATRAAALYLRYLHAHFHDWPLALAAYNAGEGRVDRALAGRPRATFWDLADGKRLPRLSRNFVPHFLALARMAEGTRTCARAPLADTTRSADLRRVDFRRPGD